MHGDTAHSTVFLFLACPKVFLRMVKRMGPGSDHMDSNHVTITHNICDFGHVT